MKNLKKNWIFLKAQFHIGILDSKTVDRSDRVKKMHENFQNLVFCNAFNLNNGKELWSTSIFKFERKVHVLHCIPWKYWITNVPLYYQSLIFHLSQFIVKLRSKWQVSNSFAYFKFFCCYSNLSASIKNFTGRLFWEAMNLSVHIHFFTNFSDYF